LARIGHGARRVWQNMSALTWLSPVAQDLLSSTAQVLHGEVPCTAKKLGSALQASASDCAGLLADPTLRGEFAKKLQGSSLEVSEKTSQQLVELFDEVLKKQAEAVKAKAAKVVAKLPTTGLVSFKDTLEALKTAELPEALRTDWVLWHFLGCSRFKEEVPCLPAEVANERVALLSCADGALADYVVKLHVLEHLDAYKTWEVSMAATKQAACSQVQAPFDATTAQQVALRRALSQALPLEVADHISAQADTAAALQQAAAAAKSATVLPRYVPPTAPVEKDAGKKKAEKEPAGAPAAKANKMNAGAFTKLHQSMGTQEYSWSLLAYMMRPGTTLSSGSGGSGGSGGSAPSKAQATTTSAVASASRPAGFSGLWAPIGQSVPPGHTDYSWHHADAGSKGFSTLWAASGTEVPPGHTAYSWEKAMAATQAKPKEKPKEKKPEKPKEVKAKAEAKAPAPKAAPQANGSSSPSDGQAALAKIDLRCGRILECSKVQDADSLYLLKINVGEEQPRQVVSSLVKHYKEEELKNRQVVVYCNIKPGKMRGLESQAMVLAATKNKGAEDEVCELLDPPAGCKEGSRPVVGDLEIGSASEGVSVKNISKVWGQVQPSLQMSDKGEATFEGATMMMKEGPVKAKSLTGVGIY